MFRPRVIPVLLLRNGGLVKTRQFGDDTYIGDPINAVRIFNDLRVDEIVLLDIDASKEGRSISMELVREIGEEANMPFAVGGGIRDLSTIGKLTSAGAERVILNTYAFERPEFITEAANAYGSSTICVCIDHRKKWGKYQVRTRGGSNKVKLELKEAAVMAEQSGAGEIIVQSINHDGMMTGYDLEAIHSVSANVSVPVVALGGAGSASDLEECYAKAYANGLAAGSLFVFSGKHRGVLIQYPKIEMYNFGE